MATFQLILQLVVLILPIIFSKKDGFQDEKIKFFINILKTEKDKFNAMSNDEKAAALNNLHNDLHNLFQLRP
ncbi:hypothetical protein CCP1ISM_2070003 [Azospirillaceae bacterium]